LSVVSDSESFGRQTRDLTGLSGRRESEMPQNRDKQVEKTRDKPAAKSEERKTLLSEQTPGSGAVAAPAQPAAVPPQAHEDVPHAYGTNCLALLVRDPSWLHAYWDISHQKYHEAIASLKLRSGETVGRVLRIYDVSGQTYNGHNANLYFDIHLDEIARNWYLRVDPERTYCAEIGLLSPRGEFCALARSNTVKTPRAGMSDVIDDKWGSVAEGYYEKLYALSGGLDVGRSSLELRRMLEERLRSEIASGAVSSFGASPVKRKEKERGFWFVLDAELIVYGATAPDATVTVQDRPVKVRPDGSFTLRFALPDGTQRIDAVARSADGVEERSIIPTVTRTTEVPEPVLKASE
jgi:uncharacterized protein